jgi:hypothetical protein
MAGTRAQKRPAEAGIVAAGLAVRPREPALNADSAGEQVAYAEKRWF